MESHGKGLKKKVRKVPTYIQGERGVQGFTVQSTKEICNIDGKSIEKG